MKFSSALCSATLIAFASIATSVFAATSTEHESHHPDGAAAAVTQIAPARSGETTQATQGMQEQMAAMREMHDKMMPAKAPDERQSLMDEHMKVMRDEWP